MSQMFCYPDTPLDFVDGVVEMNHGSGGRAMAQLIDSVFLVAFQETSKWSKNDFAELHLPPGRCVMSTDSYVISPLFFPGGDIGSLAVHGTINDLAMSGARPLYLSVGFILEEGLPLADLKKIALSMAKAAADAGVAIVTGDTKVVERGKGDGVFINTTGLGVIEGQIDAAGNRARPGDSIIVSGTVGDHGIAIMTQREGLKFESSLCSDSAALHGLVALMVETFGPYIHCLRDPTRGGVAAVLNEVAQQSEVGMVLTEAAIPIKKMVAGACELLGLDPLFIANEGKLLCFCESEVAESLLAVMRSHPLGRDAANIGTVVLKDPGMVLVETAMGGSRLLDWPLGEPLPRIC